MTGARLFGAIVALAVVGGGLLGAQTAFAGARDLNGRVALPAMDPALGRQLFVEKGCVACHAVNGVGGHKAAALDAASLPETIDPFEFAAKMWAMAPYMIFAQEQSLGEQVVFTGDELAAIVAFVYDEAEQKRFSEADLPPAIRAGLKVAD